MKIFTTNTTGMFGRWTRFLGAMLTVALIVPTTAVSQFSNPAPVNLGTAGDFVILAKTGISTTGTTSIVGNIGISPAAASLITGFGLIADASNTFSRSSLVTGKVYAADYAPPTPTKMTTAVGDMQTAYTNAAGRTLPDSTELGAGDITGKTITRGLYKWSTGVLISAAGVTISGSATDVWIFQIAQDLTVANGAIVTLSGGAKASNIFWQVAGQVTIGTTVAMKGNILCQTLIAMNTGAALNGRALAQTAVTLIANNAVTASGLIDAVTFRVNMAVKWQEGKFNPSAGDSVRVVGSFNNWSATDITVRMSRNSGSDSIWTLTRTIDSGAVNDDTVYYKFYKSPRGGDYEGVSNRVYAIVNGAHSTPLYFFDNDSVVSPLVSVNFRVNMAIKMRELTFQPQNGDTVRVVGGFQSWNTKDTSARMSKGATDSIYSRSFILNEGDQFSYKFFKNARGGLDWESGSDRSVTVPVGGGNVPLVMTGKKDDYFDRDSVFNATVQANILWQTNINNFVTLGWFDPTKDTVEVRGGFTGWSGQKTTPNPLNTSIWEYTTTNIIVPIGDQMPFKFYLRLDSANAVNKFPGLIWGGSGDNRDGYLYEHPAERGDGNSIHTVVNSTTQGPQRSYFSGIHAFGLLGATDSTTVTLKVNMGPASRYSNPFVYANDTLWVVWQDALWRAAQLKLQGSSFTQTMKMTRQSATDSVFTVSFKVKGKTHYNMQYTYRYKKQSDASVVDQGGGLGGQNPYVTRFIRRTAGVWPATYTAPTDDWKKDAPLVGETATYPTDVEASTTPPGTFELSQNYPNPFNPTTNIRYTIPQQTTVRLRVFNLLGQQLVELVNEVKPAGTHVVGFDASRLATGVYFYRIEAGSFNDVKKMVLLK